MRRLSICFVVVTVGMLQAQPVGMKPGALQSMSTQVLSTVVANRPMTLPAGAGKAAVITCQYAPARAGATAREVRNFWYEAAPDWLAGLAANHPIHTLVRGAAEQCPASLAAAEAQIASSNAARSTEAAASAPAGPSGFTAKGLSNEPVFMGIYSGDFLKVPFNREDLQFQILFSQYLQAYGTHCAAYLPKNKVEMTRQVCAREQYSVNRYGTRVGGSTCIEWRTEGTGVYADPVLYQAKTQLEVSAAPDSMREMFGMMLKKDPLGSALNMALSIAS